MFTVRSVRVIAMLRDMEQGDVVLLGDSYVEGWNVGDEQDHCREADRSGRTDRSRGSL